MGIKGGEKRRNKFDKEREINEKGQQWLQIDGLDESLVFVSSFLVHTFPATLP